jgi:hypothetical protein
MFHTKKIRATVSFILAAALLSSVNAIPAQTISSEEAVTYTATAAFDGDGDGDSDLTWSMDTETHTLSIIRTEAMYSYDDPEEIPWLAFREVVKKVQLTEGVTNIGEHAFEGFEQLRSVIIPDTVTYIGEYAFVGCKNLEELTIPKSVASIGAKAFDGCPLLTISGYEDSYALEFAKENKITFMPIILYAENDSVIEYKLVNSDVLTVFETQSWQPGNLLVSTGGYIKNIGADFALVEVLSPTITIKAGQKDESKWYTAPYGAVRFWLDPDIETDAGQEENHKLTNYCYSRSSIEDSILHWVTKDEQGNEAKEFLLLPPGATVIVNTVVDLFTNARLFSSVRQRAERNIAPVLKGEEREQALYDYLYKEYKASYSWMMDITKEPWASLIDKNIHAILTTDNAELYLDNKYMGAVASNVGAIHAYGLSADDITVDDQGKVVVSACQVSGDSLDWAVYPKGNESKLTPDDIIKWLKESDAPAVDIGDVNGDGYINTLDAVLIAQHILGNVVLTGEELRAADINGDGEITSEDTLLLAEYIVGGYSVNLETSRLPIIK